MAGDPSAPGVRLPRGIVPVLQTPFDEGGELDEASLSRLVESATAAGAAAFLAPAAASEVATLSDEERRRVVRVVSTATGGRVPLIVGASADAVDRCVEHAAVAREAGAAAFLVAVPNGLYGQPGKILAFFQDVAAGAGDLPLVIQDLEYGGPGLELSTIEELHRRLPNLVGLKIEAVPAGLKYTAVREALGEAVHISGGWAVPQMIEALDRGVDAMMPEASMVPVYVAIDRAHRSGQRERSRRIFDALLPVLAYTNQEIATSIAFFKRLLAHKGIFSTEGMRQAGFRWDRFNERIAEELIEHYLALEEEVTADRPFQGSEEKRA
jgi:4-hydroxy-tetrahydrodipicolinate synthase